MYWPISKYDQDKSQIIAPLFYGTKKKIINKNRDHTKILLKCQLIQHMDHACSKQRYKKSITRLVLARNPLPTPKIWFFGVRCTINRSHSTPCKKAEFEHLQFFSGRCLVFFLPVSGKICHSPITKVKRQPTLIISFLSILRYLRDSKKSG